MKSIKGLTILFLFVVAIGFWGINKINSGISIKEVTTQIWSLNKVFTYTANESIDEFYTVTMGPKEYIVISSNETVSEQRYRVQIYDENLNKIFDETYNSSPYIKPVFLVDLDNDNIPEKIVRFTGGRILIYDENNNLVYSSKSYVESIIQVPDANSDGLDDIAIAEFEYALDGMYLNITLLLTKTEDGQLNFVPQAYDLVKIEDSWTIFGQIFPMSNESNLGFVGHDGKNLLFTYVYEEKILKLYNISPLEVDIFPKYKPYEKSIVFIVYDPDNYSAYLAYLSDFKLVDVLKTEDSTSIIEYVLFDNYDGDSEKEVAVLLNKYLHVFDLKERKEKAKREISLAFVWSHDVNGDGKSEIILSDIDGNFLLNGQLEKICPLRGDMKGYQTGSFAVGWKAYLLTIDDNNANIYRIKDSGKPNVTIIASSKYVEESVNITVSVTENETWITSVKVFLDNEEIITENKTKFALTINLTEGEHNITVRAYDADGNIGEASVEVVCHKPTLLERYWWLLGIIVLVAIIAIIINYRK